MIDTNFVLLFLNRIDSIPAFQKSQGMLIPLSMRFRVNRNRIYTYGFISPSNSLFL